MIGASLTLKKETEGLSDKINVFELAILLGILYVLREQRTPIQIIKSV